MRTAEFGGIDGLAIDFDGVLADTVATHDKARLIAFTQMAEETGDDRFKQVDKKIHAEGHKHGSNPVAIIGWIMVEAGLAENMDDALVMQTANLKREIHHELVANGQQQIPQATNFLRAILPALEGNVTITTSASRDNEVRPFLRRHKLDEAFSDRHIVAFEDTGPNHLKPDRLAYLLALGTFSQQLLHHPERMLVVEDTPQGIASAHGVGATVVGLATTFKTSELLKLKGDERPDYIARNMRRLAEMCGLQLPNR